MQLERDKRFVITAMKKKMKFSQRTGKPVDRPDRIATSSLRQYRRSYRGKLGCTSVGGECLSLGQHKQNFPFCLTVVLHSQVVSSRFTWQNLGRLPLFLWPRLTRSSDFGRWWLCTVHVILPLPTLPLLLGTRKALIYSATHLSLPCL